MTTVICYEESVQILDGINDLATFQRWFHSDSFPDHGRFCFLAGAVWVDLDTEQLFTHNQVKNEFAFVLTGLAKLHRPGRYFPEGIQISSLDAAFSSQPYGTFVSDESLRNERVTLVPGNAEGFVEFEGVPDMVLEVVSRAAKPKDTARLIDLHWRAGIPEYWIVDARSEAIRFAIFRQSRKG